MDVSENSGTPKSSILIEFSIINHPFWGTPIFGNTRICNKNEASSTQCFGHLESSLREELLERTSEKAEVESAWGLGPS